MGVRELRVDVFWLELMPAIVTYVSIIEIHQGFYVVLREYHISQEVVCFTAAHSPIVTTEARCRSS